MKKILTTIAVIVFVLVGVFFLGFSVRQEAKGDTLDLFTETLTFPDNNLSTSTGSGQDIEEGNAVFLTVGATSTVAELFIGNHQYMTIGLFTVASTVDTVLGIEFQIRGRSGNWFDYIPVPIDTTVTASLSRATELATNTPYTWGPRLDGAAPTSSPIFTLDLRQMVGEKLRINIGASRAAASVHLTTMRK